jgi:putative CRISPR-associated protein (TIGR02620 family)
MNNHTSTEQSFVVITQHPSLVEFLREKGLVPEGVRVIAHATEADVAGCHVIGVLPVWLAAKAASFTEVQLKLTAEMRGKELDLPTLRQIAGVIKTYKVSEVETPRFG